MNTSNRPIERTRYSVDTDGADVSTKRYDEILSYEWDLAREGLLHQGESVTDFTFVDSGVVRTGVAETPTSVSFNAERVGEVEITATTSHTRTHQRVVRWYGADREARDYR